MQEEHSQEGSRQSKGKLRKPGGCAGVLITVLALAMAVFQFYTSYRGAFTPMIQRGVHLAFGFFLIFLVYPPTRKASSNKIPLYDILLAVCTTVVILYGIINFTEPTTMRLFMPFTRDLIFGVLAILLVLETARRSTGNALPVVVLFFLVYAFLGKYIPGAFGHAGVKFKDLIINNYMTLDGLMGVATGASAKTIFVLVIFGVTMLKLGGGDFLMKASYALFGTARGGPAKIAVASSALFATITGVGPANVAATGVFTIPLMKRIGYTPTFAGAVESVASSGGQIMPPVMGVAAFIMAEILNVTYLQVCLSALVPAILYFVAVYLMVHLEAVRLGMRGMTKDETGDMRKVLLQGWNFVVPLLLLILMIGVYDSSPQKAGFWAMVALLLLYVVKERAVKGRFNLHGIIKAVESGVVSALVICAISATVGIIMSVINLTGIGLKLSSILIALSGGRLFVLLIITMIASLILGMGMTTVACYIIVAVLAAPALVQMGVLPMAAHLYVFYFGIMSAITPPVAMSSFVAASIADSPPMKTAWQSLRLGLVAFLLPYMFVYSPTLLLIGDFLPIVRSIVTATIGIFALALAIQGCFFDGQKISSLPRATVFCGAVLMIHGGAATDVLGLIVILLGLNVQILRLGRRAIAPQRANNR